MEERDAVCFTAGRAGAFFGAGTIHAHLAADRIAPAVVAGISMGSLSAAALQRCYQELHAARSQNSSGGDERVEAARWKWLRQYLLMLIDKPANVFWDSIPDPTDFFADTNVPPLRDLSVPDSMQREQIQANRQKYLLTGLGLWFAKLRVTAAALATTLVRFVRYKEEYTGNWFTRRVRFWAKCVSLVATLLWHIVRHPQLVRENTFDNTRAPKRPLLGWWVYLSAWMLACALPFLLLVLSGCLVFGHWLICAAAVAPLVVAAFASRKKLFTRLKKLWLPSVLASLGFERSILHNFHLRWRLHRLFDDLDLGDTPMPALIVVAPLQTLLEDRAARKPAAAQQLWARPNSNIKVVDALTAALALPGYWPPYRVEASQFNKWAPLNVKVFSDPDAPGPIDLVDGSVVRQNPLPALLEFLRGEPVVAQLLERKADGQWKKCPRPSIHVVYSVPIEGRLGDGGFPEDRANIVDVALASQELARRRDTGVEVEQLDCITRLEVEVRSAHCQTPDIVMAVADEIAPPSDGSLDTNPLDPDPERALARVAEGCRRTLEKLYTKQIDEVPFYHGSDGAVPCGVLLQKVAARRPWSGQNPQISTGLPEVCGRCSRVLQRSRLSGRPQPELPATTPQSLIDSFPNLKVRRGSDESDPQPRIVVVWSGGVFRGAFHIGMIGALLQAKIKPDLIAGASVGTLMGGALAAMFSAREQSYGEQKAFNRLGTLVKTFRNVDQTVALTKTLKEAARDLGIRGRRIHLSPAMIRKTVLRGTRADPGFAATGAPPALIDAISDFFSIPLTETKEIAGEFIAGLIANAVHKMLLKIKEHTLSRLGIRSAIIGASLLESAAQALIAGEGVRLDRAQPFEGSRIAFFATTTNLGAQLPEVLWDGYARYGHPYDFIQAALSSSAFPAVFAPRRASDVFPGWGRTDVRYSDGGMFDNLPFLPAIGLLSQVQMTESEAWKNDPAKLARYVTDRYQNPDLFLTGALNARPECAENRNGPFHYFNDISARAWVLADNNKILNFQNAAEVVDDQIGRLAGTGTCRFADPEFVRGLVNAAVLPVFPTDKEHLNKTFAFCKSTGLKNDTVLRSIADGCFQTFHTLTVAQASGSPAVRRSVGRLTEAKRVPGVSKITQMSVLDRLRKSVEHLQHAKWTWKPSQPRNPCPYFKLNDEAFECPFSAAEQPAVYDHCTHDPAHQKVIRD